VSALLTWRNAGVALWLWAAGRSSSVSLGLPAPIRGRCASLTQPWRSPVASIGFGAELLLSGRWWQAFGNMTSHPTGF